MDEAVAVVALGVAAAAALEVVEVAVVVAGEEEVARGTGLAHVEIPTLDGGRSATNAERPSLAVVAVGVAMVEVVANHMVAVAVAVAVAAAEVVEEVVRGTGLVLAATPTLDGGQSAINAERPSLAGAVAVVVVGGEAMAAVAAAIMTVEVAAGSGSGSGLLLGATTAAGMTAGGMIGTTGGRKIRRCFFIFIHGLRDGQAFVGLNHQYCNLNS